MSPLREKRGHRVGGARAPIVSDHREAVELERIRQIDGVPRQRDCCGESRRVVAQESRWPRAAQIGGDRSPPLAMQALRHLAPAAWRIRPAVQQQNWPSFAGP
ncbi:MAG TPA: hypothetical protein VHX36_02560 [Candidatus Acidoferrales bacterium]|nr:hypothetical protein [Candidatus Acidoferrales bacterium]